jgi:amino acid transporter
MSSEPLQEPRASQAPGTANADASSVVESEPARSGGRLRRALFGPPRDVKDPHTYHTLSLVALLAWVGLGADGLSSSAYGPDEAFRALGDHTSLAALLAAATAVTVFIISYGYSRIIEHFPNGGGGYVVAGRLLGPRFGVISGAALLVDYVLTISVSMASGVDAIFSFLPAQWAGLKLTIDAALLVALTLLNLRGIKESITALMPIFMAFLFTHAILLVVAIGGHVGDAPRVAHEVNTNLRSTVLALGAFGALKLFVRAYSLGGGTYTGIEAVSNGVAVMREPRVRTAKRTMVMMATSLAVTAGGILLAYLLTGSTPEEGKTMNAVLLERVSAGWHFGGMNVGRWFTILALLTEGTLLFVAAQTGFVDGPRVMANMAGDAWMPRRFSALSDRLTMQNGVMMMGGASIAVLLYTRASVDKLVVMYSINVFLTFSLSNLGMTRFWVRHRREQPGWWRHLPAHVIALALCATILAVTVVEKFADGGWVTLLVTGALVGLCLLIKRHYGRVSAAIQLLDRELPESVVAPGPEVQGEVPKTDPVAVFFVAGYSGLGRHTILKVLQMFPHYFKGALFCGIGVVNSGSATAITEVNALEARTNEGLDRYVSFMRKLGLPAKGICRVGADLPSVAEQIARDVLAAHPRAVFVGGKLLFEDDNVAIRFLHNEAAFAIQNRLQRAGIPMVVLPVRVSLTRGVITGGAAVAGS